MNSDLRFVDVVSVTVGVCFLVANTSCSTLCLRGDVGMASSYIATYRSPFSGVLQTDTPCVWQMSWQTKTVTPVSRTYTVVQFFCCSERTSSGVFLDREQDEVVAGIERRLADFSKLPLQNGEPLHVS